MIKVIEIDPVAKPRMTQSDKWGKRKCVQEYWRYKDELKLKLGSFTLFDYGYHLTFILPMPKSWSLKKRDSHNLTPHQQTPDKDNLEKGFLDALFTQDSHIWDGRVTKLWGKSGRIVIEQVSDSSIIDRIIRHMKQVGIMSCLLKPQA